MLKSRLIFAANCRRFFHIIESDSTDMNDHRQGVKTLFQLFLILLLTTGNKLWAQDGATIFQSNCASCHSVTKELTGPALAGVEGRGPWADRKKLYEWVHNPAKFMQSDSYTQKLKADHGGVMMPAFPQLSEKEIDAIVTHINKVASAPKAAPAGGTAGAEEGKADESDSNILYGILTLILAVVALVMLQVNANLRKLADDKEGVPAHEPIPFYRNKSYITLLTLLLFVVGGFFVVKGAIGLGRTQNYEPEQPIYYSHKVHTS